MARLRIPSLRHHKASGLAVVTLSGKDHYLGPWGEPAAQKRYESLIAQWIGGGRRPLSEIIGTTKDGTPTLTVGGLCERYSEHVNQTYRKRGKPTSYASAAERVTRVTTTLYGDRPAATFGRTEFVGVRNYYLGIKTARGQPYGRITINSYTDILRAMFRWGAEQGLVPMSVWHELAIIRRLGRGRTTAPDNPPRQCAPMESVRLVQEFVSPAVRSLIEVQLLTGMRPGEACGMRVCDIDMTGPIWHYVVPPEINKMEYMGRVRIVSIGPKAQEFLRRWIDVARKMRGPKGHIFVTRTGQPFTSSTYGTMISQKCDKLGLKGDKRWTPNGLRHTAATAIRARFGLDAAQATLGHAHSRTTEIYAKPDTTEADRLAMEIG